MTDEQNDFGGFLDDDEEGTSEESTEETSGAAEEPKGEETKKSSNDDRVRTLQSRADKAEAEANKLRKQLESLQGGKEPAPDTAPEVPTQVKEWITAAESRLREQLYSEDPRFSEYGISQDRIVGDTPEQMRASAKELSKTIDKMEGSIRNKVQVEHGIVPPPSSGPPDKRVSFDKMSSEEFNAYVEKALRG